MAEKTIPEEIVTKEAAALKSIYEAKTKLAGLSQAAFGEAFGVGTQGNVWQYLNGRTPLNLSAALRFARGLEVSVRAFSDRLADELDAAGVVYPALGTAPRNEGVAEPGVSSFARVPVVGNVRGGDDAFYCEIDSSPAHGEGFVLYPTSDPGAYALRVKGDSMRPRIKPGEFVVVEPSSRVAPGDEAIVRTSAGRSMVKVMHSRRGGVVELLSINEDHKPISLDETDIDFIHRVADKLSADKFIEHE
jgi:SOS-response transcriptional repressor LexA